VGRVGAVGRSEIENEATGNVPVRELMLHREHDPQHDQPEIENVAAADPDAADAVSAEQQPVLSESDSPVVVEQQSAEELEETLRLEAFGWPRLVFPPMKRSGHVILDSCTAEGLSHPFIPIPTGLYESNVLLTR
jgi:hypothetical protein